MNTNGKMFTSNDVMRTDSLGYTYPELTDGANTSAVIAKIRELYGSNAASGGPLKRTAQVQRVSQAASKQTLKAAPGEVLADGRLQHYVANIVSQKFALEGSYAIYLFLGDVQSEDPQTWPLCPNLAGTHAVFNGYSKGKTANTDTPTGYGLVKVTGSIPLTDGLLSKVSGGDLSGMSNEDVEAYLEKNLTWRIATVSCFQIICDSSIDVLTTADGWHASRCGRRCRPGGHRRERPSSTPSTRRPIPFMA